ncbi:DUF4157 domain-containing protein [Acaryochloris sp. IP29b_bin.148]|uniref:eCIS core domain-containing protein n=1 Tax=Acaryochloris sp. IP29b_bin.148 TaxID=2969218 RepID=UPI00261285EA|nr:DUF4157 domain-containing protein [Acaryochloris sp. IP29b_bin.148]
MKTLEPQSRSSWKSSKVSVQQRKQEEDAQTLVSVPQPVQDSQNMARAPKETTAKKWGAMIGNVQRKAEGSGGGKAVNLMPKGSGRPLPPQVVNTFVQSGYPEVANARVYVDDAATQRLQATAYTQKDKIVVKSSGANDPKLLGHEATHLVQQSQMALKPDVNGTPINANPALEKNADDNGERVARNEPVRVKGISAKDKKVDVINRSIEEQDASRKTGESDRIVVQRKPMVCRSNGKPMLEKEVAKWLMSKNRARPMSKEEVKWFMRYFNHLEYTEPITLSEVALVAKKWQKDYEKTGSTEDDAEKGDEEEDKNPFNDDEKLGNGSIFVYQTYRSKPRQYAIDDVLVELDRFEIKSQDIPALEQVVQSMTGMIFFDWNEVVSEVKQRCSKRILRAFQALSEKDQPPWKWNNPQHAWINGIKQWINGGNLSELEQMNCWQTVLFAAFKGGIINKDYFTKANFQRKKQPTGLAGVMAPRIGAMEKYFPDWQREKEVEIGPVLSRAVQRRKGSLRGLYWKPKEWGQRTKDVVQIMQYLSKINIPEGYVVLFGVGAEHVAMSTGKRVRMRHVKEWKAAGFPDRKGHEIWECDDLQEYYKNGVRRSDVQRITIEDKLLKNYTQVGCIKWGPLPTMNDVRSEYAKAKSEDKIEKQKDEYLKNKEEKKQEAEDEDLNNEEKWGKEAEKYKNLLEKSTRNLFKTGGKAKSQKGKKKQKGKTRKRKTSVEWEAAPYGGVKEEIFADEDINIEKTAAGKYKIEPIIRGGDVYEETKGITGADYGKEFHGLGPEDEWE